MEKIVKLCTSCGEKDADLAVIARSYKLQALSRTGALYGTASTDYT
jgi:hypothetical protein